MRVHDHLKGEGADCLYCLYTVELQYMVLARGPGKGRVPRLDYLAACHWC